MDIVIRKPNSEEWEKYKNIRLKSLKDYPLAFGATYDETLTNDDSYWRDRIEDSINENKSFILAAFIDGEMVGIITIYWSSKFKTQHIGHLVGFYVDDRYQNKGIGSRLIKEATSRAREHDLKVINLEVVEENKKATKVYEREGFEIVGKLSKQSFFGDKYHDHILMQKIL